jgi:hypothetical protein
VSQCWDFCEPPERAECLLTHCAEATALACSPVRITKTRVTRCCRRETARDSKLSCYWPYEYERQGFALERGANLPDFYLPKQGAWLEVKGVEPSFREQDLCQCLAVETRQPVIISWGQPSWEGVAICFTPDGDRQLVALSGFPLRWASVSTLTKAINAARSARWDHGEAPKIPNLRLVE